MKPTGKKNYGSIPHLLGSKKDQTDKYITEGQHNICTLKVRDKHDTIIVQEKYDGSNVGIAKVNGQIFPLTRSGYKAATSPYKQHHVFSDWVYKNISLFDTILCEGERLCGEWMYQAHGLKYKYTGSPFVAFDLFTAINERSLFTEFYERLECYQDNIHIAKTIWQGSASCGIAQAFGLMRIDHPVKCLEKPEGAVWRVERKGKVDFLAKFVRPDHVPGKYIPGLKGTETILNESSLNTGIID